jgi:hypothetical protein
MKHFSMRYTKLPNATRRSLRMKASNDTVAVKNNETKSPPRGPITASGSTATPASRRACGMQPSLRLSLNNHKKQFLIAYQIGEVSDHRRVR